MSQGTLVDRLQRSRGVIAQSMLARTSADRELIALQAAASALQAVAVTMPAGQPMRTEPAAGPAPGIAAEPLPLVLSSRSPMAAPPSPANDAGTRLELRRFFAPALLAGSVMLLAGLMTYVTPEEPRPRFARPATDNVPVMALQPASLVSMEAAAIPPATAAEMQLIERCEVLIARGDIRAARQELARAAAEGSGHARFALAETFDPNMLAAWGMRDNVADAQIARTLYAQSLSSGDSRAAPRLAALVD